jgi:hypothetical protein
LKVPFTEGPRWFLYNNQYINPDFGNVRRLRMRRICGRTLHRELVYETISNNNISRVGRVYGFGYVCANPTSVGCQIQQQFPQWEPSGVEDGAGFQWEHLCAWNFREREH